MPSAMSRPSEPVETVSTSIDLLFLPSRMIEPLPKLRSIWESAASRAFDLSMDEPSTRRSAALAILFTPYDRDSEDRQREGPAPPVRASRRAMYTICSQFAICSFRPFGGIIPLRQVKVERYTLAYGPGLSCGPTLDQRGGEQMPRIRDEALDCVIYLYRSFH